MPIPLAFIGVGIAGAFIINKLLTDDEKEVKAENPKVIPPKEKPAPKPKPEPKPKKEEKPKENDD